MHPSWYLTFPTNRAIQQIPMKAKGGLSGMGLARMVKPLKSTKDVTDEVESTLKRYGVTDESASREILSIFKSYTSDMIVPELVSILRIMYENDTETLYSDLLAAKLIESG